MAAAKHTTRKKNVLIIGSGFIARHVYEYFSHFLGWNVCVAYVNYKNPDIPASTLVKLPDHEPQLLTMLAKQQPNFVVICTGFSFVPDVEKNLEPSIDSHLVQALKVLNAIKVYRQTEKRVDKILVVGSSSEYGRFTQAGKSESEAILPADYYGVIKACLYKTAKFYQSTYGLPICYVRQFNVTGAGQNSRFVVPSICRQMVVAKEEGLAAKEIDIGNVDAKRDFIDVRDVARAYEAILQLGKPGETYNVCSGEVLSIADIILLVSSLIDIKPQMHVNQALVRDLDESRATVRGDNSKLRALGWKLSFSITDTLNSIIDYYQQLNNKQQAG
ncbi:MAG: GDP-mannose 4,6-dehydratase [Gammaproteobacteria bacterium]|nr:GDP-mannose 4,6-dehydratase [Gammaproteobacteria bacterium]MDH5731080.1 GDP-mannose 4,6-dehydratase [Gammaproteobacteria bacterium]